LVNCGGSPGCSASAIETTLECALPGVDAPRQELNVIASQALSHL
jgi:hypothetical protein